MSDVPSNLRYTRTHEWVRDEGDGSYTMGITDHAQSEMGEIVMVELPPVGTDFEQGDVLGALEAVKTAEDFYAPMNGKVQGANESLEDDPGQINQDPYGDGWLVRFSSDDGNQYQSLMTAEQYQQYIGE